MIKTVTGRKILIVDADEGTVDELSEHFERRGNFVRRAADLSSAIGVLKTTVFDAIVLDPALPDGDGLELFSDSSALPPVLILSVLGNDSDILHGLSAGACDYAVKPCSPELVEARLSLRLPSSPDGPITVHGLTLDINERSAAFNGKEIRFTYSEFNILYFLMTHAGTFYNATQIYENVWHAPGLKNTSIKYHISNIRQKLFNVTGKQLILTAFDKGYTFISDGHSV